MAEDILKWRRGERERLIEARRSIPARERKRLAEHIAGHLAALLGPVSGKTIAFYWPIRGEPNLLPLMQRLEKTGNRCALPVVVRPREPLIFRPWRDGRPLVPGVWNIPVPEAGDPAIPDIVVAPVVGFDPDCYRLGYGGGFYDRTLAAMPHAPRKIGVGYALVAMPSIRPLPHDIAMDAIVTEAGAVARRGG